MASHEILVFNGARPERQPANDTLSLTGPLDTVTHYITATGSLIIMPGTDGALQTSNVGNARGERAIDLQMTRDADTQVASGSSSMILGGARNTANGIRAMVVGGEDNTSTGQASVILAGDQNVIDTDSHYSVIGGGRLHDLIDSSYSVICGGDTNNINTVDSCFIGGGVGHLIETGATGGVIVGGSNNDLTANALIGAICGGQQANVGGSRAGTVAGRYASAQAAYAFVGAGLSCTVTSGGVYASVVGGRSNTATADYCFVGGGYLNDATNDYGAICGGYNCDVSASYGSIGGGSNNAVSGSWGAIPGGSRNVVEGNYGTAMGYRAVSSRNGEIAYAANFIARTGDSQCLTLHMHGFTSNATTQLMYTDGAAGSEKLVMTNNTCWVFRALINGFNFDTEAESVGYEITGLCRRTGSGNIAFVGTPTSTLLGRDNASHSVTATVNTSTQSLDFVCQGTANANINWVGKVELVHVDNLP